MLTRVDRIQLAVPERGALARAFGRLLGAEPTGEDRVARLAARRTRLRVGRSELELLEPDGEGDVARALRAGCAGLFAAGFATPEPARLREHLTARGVAAHAESGQLFLAEGALGVPGLRAVISAEAEREPAGLLSFLYEVTLLVAEWKGAAERLAERLGLDAGRFVPIRSDEYGYEGTLALFREGALDRIEVVTPFDATKTMGRFFARRGAGLYMAYAESDRSGALRERLLAEAPADWTGARDGAEPDNLFVHPRALGGLLLGVSRTRFAWLWSGHPERVHPARGKREVNEAAPPAHELPLAPSRVLAVSAHPDDAEFFAGATLARLADGGAALSLVVCTDGSRGGRGLADAAAVRRREQAAAAMQLGIEEVVQLGFEDGRLAADEALRERLVGEIRRLRPELVLVHDPRTLWSRAGGRVQLGHSDHRAAGTALLDAVYPRAASPNFSPGVGGDPWCPREIWLFDCAEPDLRLVAAPFLERKLDALRAHASQEAAAGGLVDVAREMAQLVGAPGAPAEGFVRLRLW